MLTRETHARIYQGELAESKYRALHLLAKQKDVSPCELILEAIRKYMENWDPKYSLDIEELVLNDGSVRFYLWVPYEKYGELDRLMKSKGTYIQELFRKAIRLRNQIVGKK
ncbi:MAG: hypothetical protein JRJ79_17080 [Deltaproteobacteria bacterium]|nr:hypothetical protein [Deltaproteobacteria bacterium]MBW1794881.1 hypothetical protein [Deltaproteobacteria bacterium]